MYTKLSNFKKINYCTVCLSCWKSNISSTKDIFFADSCSSQVLARPCWWFVYDVCLFAVLKTVPFALPWGSPHEGQTALKRLQTNLPRGVQSRDPSGHADFRVGNKASSPDSEISRSYLQIMWSDAYVFHVFTKNVFLCTSSINFPCFTLRNVFFQSNVSGG